MLTVFYANYHNEAHNVIILNGIMMTVINEKCHN
jgi:hypothetical protein